MMRFFMRIIAAMTATTLTQAGPAQSGNNVKTPSPLVAVENEPAPRLFVDPPLPEPLAAGRVYIQYRAENIRLLPVFGTAAVGVSPRLGHVHITVDDGPWHFVDASGDTIVVVGLPVGEHRVLVELADPTHHILDRKTVSFRVPVQDFGGGHP